MRDTIGTVIYFTTYESTKQLLVKFQGSNNPTSPLSVAIAGGFCGLASWACVSSNISTVCSHWPYRLMIAQIYPIDTAKTHYQRNCLSKAKGQPVKHPKIQFFVRKQYRGKQVCNLFKAVGMLTFARLGGFHGTLLRHQHHLLLILRIPQETDQPASRHCSRPCGLDGKLSIRQLSSYLTTSLLCT